MLDPRIVRVGIQVSGGQIKWYDGLSIQASGTKYANATQNECEVKITNLNKETRDYLLTETSPFLKPILKKDGEKEKPAKPKDGKEEAAAVAPDVKSGKFLYIEAGRESYGTTVLYVGEITSAVIAPPPDIVMTIKSATGNSKKGEIVSTSYPTTSLSNIAKQISNQLGYQLVFQAKDKQISNFTFTGGVLQQVDQLGVMGRVNAYVDDNKLIVKDNNKSLANQVKLISMDTGMIGIPEITERGVKVKYLFDNTTVLGGALKVESKLNPAVNGTYSIYKLQFDISNREEQFYWIVEAKRI